MHTKKMEARLDQLTARARQIWPLLDNVRVVATRYEAFILFDEGEGPRRRTETLLHLPHPRGLDALELALLALQHERLLVQVPPTRGFVPFPHDEPITDDMINRAEKVLAPGDFTQSWREVAQAVLEAGINGRFPEEHE